MVSSALSVTSFLFLAFVGLIVLIIVFVILDKWIQAIKHNEYDRQSGANGRRGRPPRKRATGPGWLECGKRSSATRSSGVKTTSTKAVQSDTQPSKRGCHPRSGRHEFAWHARRGATIAMAIQILAEMPEAKILLVSGHAASVV